MSEANTTVLVAEDDSTIRRNLVRLLQSEGYRTIEAADGDEALAGVQANNPDAVLLDLKMPGRDGLKVLAELQPLLADLPVIVITALGGSAAAIEAMRRGAYDYLSKPFDLDEVLLTLKRALRQRALAIEVKALRARTKQNAGETQDGYDDEPELIGRSAAMLEVFKSIGLAAAMDAPVLIVGESGTGKELVAAALHRHSSRAAGPLIRV
ncbi:MAG: sigma-54-dependent transcriptional regulator, partial [Isosphaeraceae bacterium]